MRWLQYGDFCFVKVEHKEDGNEGGEGFCYREYPPYKSIGGTGKNENREEPCDWQDEDKLTE